MSKKMKLKLEDLKVQSFVTDLNQIKGGMAPTDPNANCPNPSQGCSQPGYWCQPTGTYCTGWGCGPATDYGCTWNYNCTNGGECNSGAAKCLTLANGCDWW